MRKNFQQHASTENAPKILILTPVRSTVAPYATLKSLGNFLLIP